MGPILTGSFTVLITGGLVGFEGTVPISPDGTTALSDTALSETEAIRGAANGDIPLSDEDAAKAQIVMLAGQIGYGAGLVALLPCLARLVPFLLAFGGRTAATGANLARCAVALGYTFWLGLWFRPFIPYLAGE